MQAVPCSLATTYGISVDFFSSGYLDVSVLPVRLHIPMNSGWDTLAGGFPHSDIGGSKLHCQLPPAFRRLARPSSPVIAKASTTCTLSRYWLSIGRSRVFSLGGWSPHLQTGFHVSRPTFRTLRPAGFFSHTGLSPTIASLSRLFC